MVDEGVDETVALGAGVEHDGLELDDVGESAEGLEDLDFPLDFVFSH